MQIRPITTQNNRYRYSTQQNKSSKDLAFGKVLNQWETEAILEQLFSIQNKGKDLQGISPGKFKEWATYLANEGKAIFNALDKNNDVLITLTPKTKLAPDKSKRLYGEVKIESTAKKGEAKAKEQFGYYFPLTHTGIGPEFAIFGEPGEIFEHTVQEASYAPIIAETRAKI